MMKTLLLFVGHFSFPRIGSSRSLKSISNIEFLIKAQFVLKNRESSQIWFKWKRSFKSYFLSSLKRSTFFFYYTWNVNFQNEIKIHNNFCHKLGFNNKPSMYVVLVYETVFSLRRNWAERSTIHLPLGSSSARSFKLCGVNVQ